MINIFHNTFHYIQCIYLSCSLAHLVQICLILWASFPNFGENRRQLRIDLSQKEYLVRVDLLSIHLEEIPRLKEVSIKEHRILFKVLHSTQLKSVKTNFIENKIQDRWISQKKALTFTKKIDANLIEFILE